MKTTSLKPTRCRRVTSRRRHLIGAHHAPAHRPTARFGMGKALVHAIADRAVVVQRRKDLLHAMQHLVDAVTFRKVSAGRQTMRRAGLRRWPTSAPSKLAPGLSPRRWYWVAPPPRIGRERLSTIQCGLVAGIGERAARRSQLSAARRDSMRSSAHRDAGRRERHAPWCEAAGHTHAGEAPAD